MEIINKNRCIIGISLLYFIALSYSCDSHEYKMYATFDEMSMCGVGKPSDSLYVSVKQDDNVISVIRSDDKDNTIKYILIDGTWYNYQAFDLHKMSPDYRFFQSEKSFPSSYDRYLFNDTIIEYEKIFGKNGRINSRQISLKTNKDYYLIYLNCKYDTINEFNKLNSLLRIIKTFKNRPNLNKVNRWVGEGEEYGYLTFQKLIKGDSISYVSETQKNIIVMSWKLNSLGEYGLKPGLDIAWDNYYEKPNYSDVD